MNTIRITGDGTYPIPRNKQGGNADKLIVLASGVYGTAVAHLHILNGAGAWVALVDGEILVDVQSVLHAGGDLRFALVVTGSDGTTNIIFDTEETG